MHIGISFSCIYVMSAVSSWKKDRKKQGLLALKTRGLLQVFLSLT